MLSFRISSALAGLLGALILSGCATRPRSQVREQLGESMVFLGEEPSSFAWLPTRQRPIRLRSTYAWTSNTVEYLPGRDFVVDYSKGTLRRTPASPIPDFRTNVLYRQVDFDHSRFPGFGNRAFFAYADYSCANSPVWPARAGQPAGLEKTRAKLLLGRPVTMVAFGDSITAGLEVSPEFVFWNRWADELRSKHPGARITVQNGATSGDSTVQGLERLQAKVLDVKPDLVLVGFGMNDHNRQGVPVAQFEANLKEMLARIRQKTEAEVILYSAFPPNPLWKFGSRRMNEYAAATARVAEEVGCAYADVFKAWQTQAARKRPEDLLANNINHPNEFGHWIYYRALSALGL